MKPRIYIIAAIDENNALGYRNRLLFYLSDDLKRFKALTTGHTIIMGRHTFESLPKGALPHRRNIVLSTSNTFFAGAERFASLQEALDHCEDDDLVYIIGGASLYRQAIEQADELCMTEIHAKAPAADVYFPPITPDKWCEKKRESHPADEKHVCAFDFVDYVRCGEENQ